MHRLTVYISLLVFGPAFLMAIQSYLPFRASLSIPEALIETLIISTAIFSALSLLRVRTGLQELTRDGLILFLSFFSCSYILYHFHPLFPASALPVFSLAISPYVVAIFGVFEYRSMKQFAIPRLDWQHFYLAFFGIFLLELGFFLAAFYYGGYLAMPGYLLNNLGIIGLAIATIGLILVALSGALSRTRSRLFDNGVV